MDDELQALLASRVGALGMDLLEADVRPGVVRLVVDREGGADVDSIAEATRAVSSLLDRHDPQPGHRYTLEVSSPGIERPLRLPRHFERALGETVSVRTASGGEGERRFTGRLSQVDGEGFVLEGDSFPEGGRRFLFSDVERARTVFEWPSPNGAGRDRRHTTRTKPAKSTAGARGSRTVTSR